MRYVHPDAEDILEIASAVQQARVRKVATFFATAPQQETEKPRKM